MARETYPKAVDPVIYIPANIRTGKSKYENGYRAITFKSTNRAWIQPSRFQNLTGFTCIDKPQNAEIAVNRDVKFVIEDFENTPSHGFRFKGIRGFREDSMVDIEDPKGFTFGINFMRWLWMINSGVTIGEGGVLGGAWCYCCNPQRKEVFIINTNDPRYVTASKEADILALQKTIKKNINVRTMKVGTVYRMYASASLTDTKYERVVYLGQFPDCCDIEKFSTMIELVSENSSHAYYRGRAKQVRDRLIKNFDRTKHVFIRLVDKFPNYKAAKYQNGMFVKCWDQSVLEDITYARQHNKEPSKDYDWLKYCFLEDLFPQYHDYAISFSTRYCYDNSILVTSGINNAVIRMADDDQELKIKEDWTRQTGTGYNIRHTRRYERLREALGRDPVLTDFQYQTYTVDQLLAFVKHCFSTYLIPFMNLTSNL